VTWQKSFPGGNVTGSSIVYRTMHRTPVLLVVGMLALTACGPAARPPSDQTPPAPTVSGSADTGNRAQIYAAVIRRLVTKDHTFGRGPSPFEYVYVVDGAIPGAGNVRTGLRPAPEPFADALKQAVEDRLQDLPRLEFITDPDSVRLGKQGVGGVKNDGVIISLSPIEPVQDEVHVSTGLWCGGLCGQWLTYVLSQDLERWKITGTTGPYAIS
jgi:hypothetical protein